MNRAARRRRAATAARQPQYQREYRQRAKHGEMMLRILVGPKVIDALIARGLSDQDSRDRTIVARELADVLEQWTQQWLR